MNNNFAPIKKRKPLEGKSLMELFKDFSSSSSSSSPKQERKKAEVIISVPKGTVGCVRKR